MKKLSGIFFHSRWFFAVIFAVVVNTFFFLAIPVLNVLLFKNDGAPRKVQLEELTEVETVVREKKKTQPQKMIHKIVQPNKFKLNSTANSARSKKKKLGVAGYVKIYMVIDVYGNVTDVKVLSIDPPGYGFETEALKAIRSWKFEPAKLGHYPVAQKATKEFKFVP